MEIQPQNDNNALSLDGNPIFELGKQKGYIDLFNFLRGRIPSRMLLAAWMSFMTTLPEDSEVRIAAEKAWKEPG